MSEPTIHEAAVTSADPTCALLGVIPGDGRPWPAHTWTSPTMAFACQRCPAPMNHGDRYVCVEGGITHLTCPPRPYSPPRTPPYNDPAEVPGTADGGAR